MERKRGTGDRERELRGEDDFERRKERGEKSGSQRQKREREDLRWSEGLIIHIDSELTLSVNYYSLI